MMVLKDKSRGIPDGFRFTHAETAHVSRGTNYWEWENAIMEHRKANNLPIPDNMMEIAMDQACQQIDPHWCDHADANTKRVSTRFSLSKIMKASAAYAELFAKKLIGSDDVISQEEANRRGKICASCFLRARPEGCGSCAKMAEFVTGAIAKLKTPYDAQLDGFACGVCLCPLAPIVHFPLSILEKNDSEETQALYPDFCWRSKQSPNYQPNELVAA